MKWQQTEIILNIKKELKRKYQYKNRASIDPIPTLTLVRPARLSNDVTLGFVWVCWCRTSVTSSTYLMDLKCDSVDLNLWCRNIIWDITDMNFPSSDHHCQVIVKSRSEGGNWQDIFVKKKQLFTELNEKVAIYFVCMRETSHSPFHSFLLYTRPKCVALNSQF